MPLLPAVPQAIQIVRVEHEYEHKSVISRIRVARFVDLVGKCRYAALRLLVEGHDGGCLMHDPVSWLLVLGAAVLLVAGTHAVHAEPIPDKTVVLTFDDAVRSHLTFVAPLLKEHGFQATFFVSDLWLDDREHFLSWKEVGELHALGFEVGNHTWTHSNFSSPKMAARLAGELSLVERELAAVGVPKPVSFAWPGNGFGPEAMKVLHARGYRFARRGMQPEVPYGKTRPGPLYDPASHHPLLIPSAGDAYPEWDLNAVKQVVDRAVDGHIAVVQFHGVPDEAHPWVHTPPERFREYMDYLASGGFKVIAMRDLAQYACPESAERPPLRGYQGGCSSQGDWSPPTDAMAFVHYSPGGGPVELPPEVLATRANLRPWLENMLLHHRYSLEEAAAVCAYPPPLLERKLAGLELQETEPQDVLRVLPYPGGRHPRTGFLDGAIDPMRGTKLSVFAPWAEGGYVVVDLPEALWADGKLAFLAHTHIPTIWDEDHVVLDNIDWTVHPSGALEHARRLPNGVRLGASAVPRADHVEMLLWLENGSQLPLTGLRAQVCIMLPAATGFEALTNDGKRYEGSVAMAPSEAGTRWVLVSFEQCVRPWGNADVPCIHADPGFPDAAPGERVEVRGRLWFYEGEVSKEGVARYAF